MTPAIRRTLTLAVTAAVLIGGLVALRGAASFRPAASADPETRNVPMIPLHLFNRHGELIGPLAAEPLHLTEAEWRQRLTPEQFDILRSQGTERPFCGTLLDNKQEGVYACAGCGLPLFSSDSKFNSGTGWPSFFQPIADTNVLERPDDSYGHVRTEIVCARCEGHLGHVFDDGPPPTGRRHCLNSESLVFTSSDELASLADPAAENPQLIPAAAAGKTAEIVLAGGCFWCTEAAFEQLVGVSDVESGYAGGSAETANYEAVCRGDTDHAEVIRVRYNPEQISLDQLLDVFFDAHDPTTLNRQGNDVGSQYRSAIFYANQQQFDAANAKIQQLDDAGAFASRIVTTLEPLEAFYPAEAYHQDYARQNPNQGYIQAISTPKVCKVRDKHPSLIRPDAK